MQGLCPLDPLLRAEAAALLADLEAYDEAGNRLVETWVDMDLYASFSGQIDAIRARGPAIPTLMVPLLQLVIAHSELVCTLWQNASVGGGAAQLKEAQARHADAIAQLRTTITGMLRSD